MGQGPRLTARTVATDPATEIADWHFKLGEIELFGAPGLSGWHASNSHTRWNMRTTTAPAPMTAWSPIVIPGVMIAPVPRKTPWFQAARRR